MTTREDKEPFLARWARLKREAAEETAKAPGVPERKSRETGAPPALPPLDQLSLESDFRQFFHPKVSEALRRAALKKLFSDPHFNTMDGLDVYIEDYSKFEPLPAEMLAALRQARDLFARSKESDTAGQAENTACESAAPDTAQEGGATDRLARALDVPRLVPAEPDPETQENSPKPAATGK